mgnify:CR=1 FL=1
MTTSHLQRRTGPSIGLIGMLALAACLTTTVRGDSSGAMYTWNGSVDSNWQNSSNWDEGGYPDNRDNVVFNDPAAAPNQPDLQGYGKGNSEVIFNQAGWTISDSVGTGYLQIRGAELTSKGAGVNEIASEFRIGGNRQIRVASENTCLVSGLLNFSDNDILHFYDETGGTGPAGRTVFENILDVVPPSGGGQPMDYVMHSGTVIFGDRVGYYHLDATNATVHACDEIVAGTTTAFHDGSTLAIGGDGEYGGDEIMTIGFSALRGGDHGVNLYDGSTLAIDFTSSAADKLEIDSEGSRTAHLLLGSTSTLELSGICDAGTTHTLVDFIGTGTGGFYFGDNGTFGSVLLNGEPVDPASDPRLDLTYYTGDRLDVTFNQTIPEPSVLCLLALGALPLLARRQRG